MGIKNEGGGFYIGLYRGKRGKGKKADKTGLPKVAAVVIFSIELAIQELAARTIPRRRIYKFSSWRAFNKLL